MEEFKVLLQRTQPVNIACTFIPSSTPTKLQNTLIIFINGIDNPSSIWHPTVDALKKRCDAHPPLLLFDRPGQGRTTDRNLSIPGRPKFHGRDCLDAAHDLREVIANTSRNYLGIREQSLDSLNLFFVASSVGCAIVRLYAQHYPKSSITGLIFLDSTIANSDTVSIIPDPDADGFNQKDLKGGTTVEELRQIRAVMQKWFHSESPNKEGLWRGNLPDLLPLSYSPKIKGVKGGSPYLSVFERDASVEEKAAAKFGIPMRPWKGYFAPHWHEYNEGLAKLVPRERSKGPLVAKGCGHLIHKDGPDLVADEIIEILTKLRVEEEPRSKM